MAVAFKAARCISQDGRSNAANPALDFLDPHVSFRHPPIRLEIEDVEIPGSRVESHFLRLPCRARVPVGERRVRVTGTVTNGRKEVKRADVFVGVASASICGCSTGYTTISCRSHGGLTGASLKGMHLLRNMPGKSRRSQISNKKTSTPKIHLRIRKENASDSLHLLLAKMHKDSVNFTHLSSSPRLARPP